MKRMKKVFHVLFTSLMTAAMIIGCLMSGNAEKVEAAYNGSTDISAAAVDSITITNSSGESDGTVDDWSNFYVNVAFSEDDANGNQKAGLDIQSGDTITIRWTAPSGIAFTGYTSTVNLYPDNDSSQPAIATAVVSSTGCTITFNDNVNTLQHVSGTVYFEIKVTGSLTSSDTTGRITSGSVTTEVDVDTSGSTGVVTFSHKSATYSTDGTSTILWSIWINEDYRTDLTGTIVITDTLPSTETYSGFDRYSKRDTAGDWTGIASTEDDFNTGGRSFVYDSATNTITIMIPASELNTPVTGLIVFMTASTASAGETVENTAEVTYYEESNPTVPTTDTDTGSVTVPSTGGTITGLPQGNLEITKVVNNDSSALLAGVTFRVYQVVSDTDHTRVSGWYDGADYAEVTTGSDGVATLTGLDDGYYEIVEVTDSLPEWIATSDIETVYVYVGESAGTAETISNSVKTDSITATKYWYESDGTTADISDEDRTVYFKLYRDGTALSDADLPDSQSAIQAVTTAAGESSGTVTWRNLPLYDNYGNTYTYTVKEVDAEGNDDVPEGYYKTESGLTVTNTELSYTDVKATKLWTQNDGTTADTSDHETIYFQLYRDGTALSDDDLTDGQTAIQAVATDEGESSATVTWENLPVTDSSGNTYTYTVKEVDENGDDYTPDGYTKCESGLTVTNKKDITYSDITATKIWTQNDGTTADTSDHETIYFQLYRNGEALSDDDLADDQSAIQVVATASGESTATVTWTDLPDTDTAGNAYTYTVKEVDAEGNDYTPDGYTKSEDGLTVPNKKDITYSDITATKKWTQNDGTTADTSTHETIYFQLYRDGTALSDDDLTDSQTAIQAVTTAEGESSAAVTWQNLAATDSAGNAYTYTVKEVDAEGNDYTPDGYTKSEDGLTVTNKKDITYSDITATKIWMQNDGTTADTSDHETIYFQLYRDGTALTDNDLSDGQSAIQTVETASGDSIASAVWTDLPETDSAGNAYTYTVKEVDAEGNDYVTDGYTKSENGLIVTNTREITYSDITATKNWTQNDGITADTSDHETIYFQLYRNGEALSDDDLSDGQTALQAVETVSGESTVSVTWENLPDYDSAGNTYTYTVKEVDADGNDYVSDGYSKDEDGLTVTNRKDLTYSDITATKIWLQNDGTTADTTDHEIIYFRLYRNGEALSDDDLADDQSAIQAVVTASGESTAEVIWTDLPDTDSAGNAYTYTVKEVDAQGNDYVPDGYTKSEDGLTVTNTREIAYSDITATKLWLKADGITPDTSDHPTVYFQLYRNGIALSDADLSDGQSAIQAVVTDDGDSTASVTWNDLPEYDSAGNTYTYTVKETDADGTDYVPSGYTKTELDLTVVNKRTTHRLPTTSDTPNTSASTDTEETDSSSTIKAKLPATTDTGVSSHSAFWLICLVIACGAILAIESGKHRKTN